MLIESLVDEYIDSRPTNILDRIALIALFIEAVREYQAWAALDIENQNIVEANDSYKLISDNVVVTESTDINASEWGIIKPLAYLYVEKQEAMIQEAGKNHMHELFGRSTAEVEQDITAYRNDQLRHLSFSVPVMTI